MSDTRFMQANEDQEEFVKRAGVARRAYEAYTTTRPLQNRDELVVSFGHMALLRLIGAILKGERLEIDRGEAEGELIYQKLADVFDHFYPCSTQHEIWQYTDVLGNCPDSRRD